MTRLPVEVLTYTSSPLLPSEALPTVPWLPRLLTEVLFVPSPFPEITATIVPSPECECPLERERSAAQAAHRTRAISGIRGRRLRFRGGLGLGEINWVPGGSSRIQERSENGRPVEF